MKNTLFILTEDLNNGVIQSQVFGHIDFMKKKKISNFSILYCYWSEVESRSSLEKIKSLKKINKLNIYSLKIFPPSLPFSLYLNQNLILKFLLKKNINFDFVHARTDLCAVMAKKIKYIFKVTLIWDCRGYAPAEVDYNNTNFKFIKKIYLYYRFRQASKTSDKVVVVSTTLEQLVRNTGNLNTYLIPSVASKNLFFFNPKIRNDMRKKMKFNKSSIVLIYSGSFKKYQMIDETISFFRSTYVKNKNCYMIFLTNDQKIAKKYISGIRNIMCFSVKQNEVNDYLNAADFAIMIRKKDLTNKTASPTKFSEYCLAGLNVITNSSVIDFYKFKNKVNNIKDLSNCDIKTISNISRKNIADFYKQKLSKESFIKKFEALYE